MAELECEWLEVPDRRAFTLYPLKSALLPDRRVNRRRPASLPYVLVSTYGPEGIVARHRCSRERAGQLALRLAERSRDSVLVARQVSVADDGKPLYETIGQVLAHKADPLGNEQLESWILSLTRELRKLGNSEAERLATRALGILDMEYSNVDARTITRALDQVQSVIANPATRFMTSQQQSIAQSLQRVVGRTWRGTARLPRVRDGLKTGFSIPDREVSRLLSRHHSFWVRNRFGDISGPMSERARRIISRGVSEGLGRNEISRRLERHFGEGLKQKGYWRTVAANHVTRARSYSMGSTMQAAGVEFYRIEAVLDDRTTHQCVFLHHKILPVNAAVQRAQSVMRSDDPRAVMREQPFIQDRGDRLVVEYPNGQAANVAMITERSSGISPSGPSARFSGGMNQTQMVDAAIGFPPYHHGCRTTITAM